ncbi:hypothetical protein L7F22_006518 [Adiantum nelumboides]|nr:hypothetical protein [Adiantum nelumboides]
MGDHELEEGEACDEPDISCDPDTDFSYLDEKLSVVLGDQQKCFEGGVSAEKLGSKFGGYGSFLPTQERPLLKLHQDKPASMLASDASCRTKTNEGIIERIKQNATGSSVRTSGSRKGSSAAVLTNENGGGDCEPINEKTTSAPSSFLVGMAEDNTGHLKKVRLKIKMGSENKEKKKKATIYSHFGLSNSSSEGEEFMDEDGRTDSDPDPSPDRTPLTMIRLMTSHHIPDGMLLSPLRDLVTESFMQKERLWSACEEDVIEKVRSPDLKKVNQFQHGDTFEKLEVSMDKSRDHAVESKGDSARSSDRAFKRVKVDKERGGSKDSKPPLKAHRKDLAKMTQVERQARDAVSESETGIRSNDSHKDFKGFCLDRAPPDYVLYDTDHVSKDFCSLFQLPKDVDSGREQQSRAYRAEKVASSSYESINEHRDVGNEGRDESKEALNTLGINSHGKRHLEISSVPSDGKKRSSGKGFLLPSEERTNSGQNARSSSYKGKGAGKVSVPATEIPTRETVVSKKQSIEYQDDADVSRGSFQEKGKILYKETQMSFVRDKYSKSSSETDFILDETPKDGRQHYFKEAGNKDSKHSQQEHLPKVHMAESLEHRQKEKVKKRVTHDFVHKDLPKVSEDRSREVAARDLVTKVSQSACAPEGVSGDKLSQAVAVPPQPAANGVTSYVVVMENWVGCDKCEKWRLLPPGVDDKNLPNKWRCKMQYWLEKEGLNNCSVSTDITNQATRVLYNISAPIPPPVEENLLVREQVQPPVSVVTTLPLSNVISNQEIKAPENIIGAASVKKQKIPRTASTDNTVPGKKKSFAEAPQVSQDDSQAKLGDGDTIITREKFQAKVGSLDLGSVKPGEEKQKAKEKDKARRHRPSDGSSPSLKKHSQTPAILALREATKLKHKANSLQGQERTGTALYLQAALKFLQAAYMLESEASEHLDKRPGPHPVQIYADTATLCEYCASTYERCKDLAVAALAYKCAGVARMRVVQAKSSLINRCRAEVQNAQQVAQGDSPSSSTQADRNAPKNSALDKTLAVEGSTFPSLNSGGPLIIAAKSRVSFTRILDFVLDTSSALDALTKSLNAFTAAESALSSFTIEGMSALRKVLDYSFHDVDSFVRLVRIALEVMGH